MTNETSHIDSSFHQDRHPQPDAQGQAALLLVESLIHSLMDNGTLTKPQALEVVESAMQVKEESAADEKEPARTLRKSLGLLLAMRQTIAAHSGRDEEMPQTGPQADQ